MMETQRLQVDPAYLQSVGRAFYTFAYLEWVVVTLVARVSGDDIARVPRGETATVTAKALARAVSNADPALPYTLRRDITMFVDRFREAIRVRNRLLHAHPYSASGTLQQLRSTDYDWPIARVDEAGALFESIALEATEIFHGAALTKARPSVGG